MRRDGLSTVVRRRRAKSFGWNISVRGNCAVRQVGCTWSSSRDTDERERNDTTEHSELYNA